MHSTYRKKNLSQEPNIPVNSSPSGNFGSSTVCKHPGWLVFCSCGCLLMFSLSFFDQLLKQSRDPRTPPLKFAVLPWRHLLINLPLLLSSKPLTVNLLHLFVCGIPVPAHLVVWVNYLSETPHHDRNLSPSTDQLICGRGKWAGKTNAPNFWHFLYFRKFGGKNPAWTSTDEVVAAWLANPGG